MLQGYSKGSPLDLSLRLRPPTGGKRCQCHKGRFLVGVTILAMFYPNHRPPSIFTKNCFRLWQMACVNARIFCPIIIIEDWNRDLWRSNVKKWCIRGPSWRTSPVCCERTLRVGENSPRLPTDNLSLYDTHLSSYFSIQVFSSVRF